MARKKQRDLEGPPGLSKYAKKLAARRITSTRCSEVGTPMPIQPDLKPDRPVRRTQTCKPSDRIRSETLSGIVTLMRPTNNFLFIRTTDSEDVHIGLHILKRDYAKDDVRLGFRITCIAEYRSGAKRPSATKILSVVPPG